MFHSEIRAGAPVAVAMPDWATPRAARARRGSRAHYSGLAAEDGVARHYEARGARIAARRHRTAEGEIDLVVRDGDCLVFVEVKRRKHLDFDSPVSERQWHRLACASLNYMLETQQVTCTTQVCRFDVAIVDAGGQVRIIENARTFD